MKVDKAKEFGHLQQPCRHRHHGESQHCSKWASHASTNVQL